MKFKDKQGGIYTFEQLKHEFTTKRYDDDDFRREYLSFELNQWIEAHFTPMEQEDVSYIEDGESDYTKYSDIIQLKHNIILSLIKELILAVCERKGLNSLILEGAEDYDHLLSILKAVENG